MVYRLWLETKGLGLNRMDDSREGIEKYLNRNPGTCFIAKSENQVLGTILSGHDGRRGFIYHLAVAEPFRHQGIGKALVNRAVGALKNQGIKKVAFVVYKRNKGANHFWDKLGFGERKDLFYRDKIIGNEEIQGIDT